MPNDLADLDAIAARDMMARGDLAAVSYVGALLERIAEREPEIGAFVHLQPQSALAQAEACDARRASGDQIGSLHGVAVAIKDIVDTSDLPTENGTPLDAGRRPAEDAVVVARLKEAGAVILGKTVTTELGARHPGGTRNPHHREHTPGGSSSGSAAAVGARMAPLAIGTQTNGSVIRPASFCGVVGFKPSFGLIPRTGILPQAPPLDTAGVFARSVPDAALIVDALAGYDPRDRATRALARPHLLDTALTEPPATPSLAFVKTMSWDLAEVDTQAGFADLIGKLADRCEEVPLTDRIEDSDQVLMTLTNVGIARTYGPYHDRGAGQLSDFMRTMIEDSRTIPAVDYLDALDRQAEIKAELDHLFERYDAIVTPAAPGAAPHGLESTGNSAFNNLWSLCGLPAITLPLLESANGLPIGVQLVGRHGEDGELLRTARWLQSYIADRSAWRR
ncbi:amidase [Bauldia sp.]|uniref:amidase n=1 Tax=Bauldia sp. TaxID=2575872 RepID=UPI0025BE370A|nr:amidase [Bauldia sp.]